MCKNGFKVIGILFATVLLGCATAQWKSTKTVGGKTTVTGDAETMKREEAKNEAAAARIEAIRKADKRLPTDPIIVAVYRPEVGAQLQGAVNADILNDMLRKEFQKDHLIVLVSQSDVDRAQKASGAKHGFGNKRPSVPADISVFTAVRSEEKVGINRNTKKFGKMVALVFSGDIVSHYLPEDQFKIQRSDNIFRNTALTAEYA